MKKLILLAIFLISIIGAMAFTMPHPIYGIIKNNDAIQQNIQMKYENINSGIVQYTNTDSRGFYQFELANIDTGYRNGDTARISIVSCSGTPACSNTFILGDGGNKVDFNLNGQVIPVTPVCESEQCEICEMCQVCQNPTCPTCPTCQTCPTCPTNDCPIQDNWLISLLTGLGALGIGGMGVYFWKRKEAVLPTGTAIRYFKKTDGTSGLQHKHYGLTGYHDPKIVHSDLKERHPKGQIDPEYVKDETGKYVYKG